jgi:hypothetical protein
MMSTSITSVTNKLESANNLSHGKETQQLSTNDSSGNHLRRVDISDLIQDAGWVSVGRGREEDGWVSYALDETLEVCLEGRDRSILLYQFPILSSHFCKPNLRRSHALSLEYKPRKLQSNSCIVDSRWDLPCDRSISH